MIIISELIFGGGLQGSFVSLFYVTVLCFFFLLDLGGNKEGMFIKFTDVINLK